MHKDDRAAEVAALQRRWIFEWDRRDSDPDFDFDADLAHYYDLDADDVLLFDDFDPERRVLRSAAEYGGVFVPAFNQMRAAEHAIERAPEVIVSGDLAATQMVFIARLTAGDGTVTATRAVNSQVWRSGDGRWRIVRDHTSVETIALDEADRALATLPRS
jgi:ketosteroid isomerase-like protein